MSETQSNVSLRMSDYFLLGNVRAVAQSVATANTSSGCK